LDSTGTSLYIADQANNRIRLLSGGTVTTIAGTGSSGFNGDSIAPLTANINSPQAVIVDSAIPPNVYIADFNNWRVRKVSGGLITTVAGTGNFGVLNRASGDGGVANAAEIIQRNGLAQDSGGHLDLSDTGGMRA